ncbi:hypothetical protein D3C87_504970 [compost metagenome]
MSLVQSWLRLPQQKETQITDIANNLADKFGRTITISRLREWEDGRRGIPIEVHNFMLEDILYHELARQPDYASDLYKKLQLPT